MHKCLGSMQGGTKKSKQQAMHWAADCNGLVILGANLLRFEKKNGHGNDNDLARMLQAQTVITVPEQP